MARRKTNVLPGQMSLFGDMPAATKNDDTAAAFTRKQHQVIAARYVKALKNVGKAIAELRATGSVNAARIADELAAQQQRIITERDGSKGLRRAA